MPHPTLVTTWPAGNDLRSWLSENGVSAQMNVELVDEVMADASAKVYESIDPGKLPVDVDQCPRTVARAIVLEAARLLYRRQSAHGVAAFGDVAIRLRTADVDVEKLLQPYMLESDP